MFLDNEFHPAQNIMIMILSRFLIRYPKRALVNRTTGDEASIPVPSNPYANGKHSKEISGKIQLSVLGQKFLSEKA